MSDDITQTGVTAEMGKACAALQDKHFKELVEFFGSPVNAGAQFMAYGVDAGKHLGLTKEKYLQVCDRLWEAAEVAAELVKTGRASGPEGYARLEKAIRGERILEAVETAGEEG